jgi:hypothetical protein
MWNFNLPDAAYGSLVFNIHQGIISSEMKSYGLNFSYRRGSNQSSPAPSSISATTPEKPNQYRNSVSDWSQQTPQQQQDFEANNRNSRRQSMVNLCLHDIYNSDINDSL